MYCSIILNSYFVHQLTDHSIKLWSSRQRAICISSRNDENVFNLFSVSSCFASSFALHALYLAPCCNQPPAQPSTFPEVKQNLPRVSFCSTTEAELCFLNVFKECMKKISKFQSSLACK